jgi:hypothetical protein
LLHHNQGVAKLIMLRTLYTMIRLDLRLYQKYYTVNALCVLCVWCVWCVVCVVCLGILGNSVPRGAYHRKRMEERQDLTLQASLFNVGPEELVGLTATTSGEDGLAQPASPTSDQCGSGSRRGSLGQDHDSFPRLPLPPYKTQGGVSFATLIALKENHWANFFGTPPPPPPRLAKLRHQRHTATRPHGHSGSLIIRWGEMGRD